jgi:hypothetical protein
MILENKFKKMNPNPSEPIVPKRTKDSEQNDKIDSCC